MGSHVSRTLLSVGGICIPEQPDFADKSEEVVWSALRKHLQPEDVLLHGIRFTDPTDGDVEIDLILLIPSLGAIAIEVKGGFVTYADGGFSQSDADETRPIEPIEQARKGLYALKRFASHQPTWSRGELRAAWMASFPYTQVTAAMGPEGRRDTIIGADDLDSAYDMAVARLMDAALHTRVPAEGWVDDLVDLLRGAAYTPVEIVTRTALRRRRIDELTEAQENLLSFISPNSRYEVVGSAGTGKTWLATEQARRWAREGERVCFVTYGRGVARMVSDISDGFPRRHRPDFIGTFHQLGTDWGVRPSDNAGQDFWSEEMPRRMVEAASELPSGHRFTAYVVDEAQDFADSWWPALLASAQDDNFKLAIFRDDEQAVFTDRRGRPAVDLVPFRLSDNMRNARSIVDTFRPLVTTPPRSRGGDGYGVEFIACEPGEEITCGDDQVERLLEAGWLPEHVALLTTQHRHPVQREYEKDRDAYWAQLADKDVVFYSTVAGFKGLERPAVVLVVDGFHDGVQPSSVMYTGMSRASDLLVVVGPHNVVSSAIGEASMRRLEAD